MPCSHLLKFQFLEVALWGDFSISHKIPSLISDFEWIVMFRCNYLLKSNFRLCRICLSKMIFSFFVLRIGLLVCLALICLNLNFIKSSPFSVLTPLRGLFLLLVRESLQAASLHCFVRRLRFLTPSENRKTKVFRFPFSVIYNNLLKTSPFCYCIYRRFCIYLRYESND